MSGNDRNRKNAPLQLSTRDSQPTAHYMKTLISGEQKGQSNANQAGGTSEKSGSQGGEKGAGNKS